MLADSPDALTKSGSLGSDVHLPATSRSALLDFIREQLPGWRDRPDRKSELAETNLTSQLCAHLNSVARHSDGWDFLQFRVEEPDERRLNRKVDLVPAPCGSCVWIEGRRHTDFDPLLPIECKRLPTPADAKRDEREYVINRRGSTGGIQRFKAGHHGAAHTFGAMIAYVQQETAAFWDARVREWIQDLVDSGEPGWNTGDLLQFQDDDKVGRVAVLRSSHTRDNGLPMIELRHLWVQMN